MQVQVPHGCFLYAQAEGSPIFGITFRISLAIALSLWEGKRTLLIALISSMAFAGAQA